MRLPLSLLLGSLFLIPIAKAQPDCPTGPGQLSTNLTDIRETIFKNFGDKNCQQSFSKDLPSLASGLSPLWAQEQIGSDLAKDFLLDLEKSGESLNTPLVANIDGGYKGTITASLEGEQPKLNQSIAHGTQVVNLIGGKGSYGVAAKARVLPLDYFNGGFDKAATSATESRAEIVNLEVHTVCTLNRTSGCIWPNEQIEDKNVSAFLNKASSKKLIVAAAGNNYPAGSTYKSHPALANTILVGSANEEGLISSFSDQSPDVTILAPSDSYLTSPGANGETRFGGTSGATPLVSGALANVLSIISPLSVDEAKTLLRRTATPLPATSISKVNGTGLLNAYKLVRVAERLRKAGWPTNKAALNDKSIYDFSDEASKQTALAQNLLAKKDRTCDDLKTIKTQLRKSFLLNPTGENSQLLAMTLSAAGYPKDAGMYSIRTEGNLKFRHIIWEKQSSFSAARIRSQYDISAQAPVFADSYKNWQTSALIKSYTPPSGDIKLQGTGMGLGMGGGYGYGYNYNQFNGGSYYLKNGSAVYLNGQ